MQLAMNEASRIGPAHSGAGAPAIPGRVHLIGAGGSGMRALGRILLARGSKVSGSDAASSAALESLKAAGAAMFVGQSPDNLPADCDLVVASAAIHEANPELLAARDRGVEVVKYSQMLGRLMAAAKGIAVAGTHGKSTTTAMVAWALAAAGRDPSYIVGATVPQLGGPSGAGAGWHFVAEACEFDGSFLNLSPTYAAILNVEEDHLDCYEDLDAIVEAFRAFAAKVPPSGVLVANGEDRNVQAACEGAACDVHTFGLNGGSRWLATNVTSDRGRFRFDATFEGRTFCRVKLQVPGIHNVYNALAATVLCHHAGLSGEEVAAALGKFEGVYRRMTIKAQLAGVTVVDDYAHHPTEIQVTLRAIRDYFQPRRIWCVFQPHQHSRTRFLLKDFARSFGCADKVVVPDIYFVRDSQREAEHISAADLVAQIRLIGSDAVYLKGFDEIVEHLQGELAPGDLVVTMGAGNIWEVADQVVRWLGTDR
jgi:UDP-N-acetylmuramate--alanine ligase